jgi:hypothetical protein
MRLNTPGIIIHSSHNATLIFVPLASQNRSHPATCSLPLLFTSSPHSSIQTLLWPAISHHQIFILSGYPAHDLFRFVTPLCCSDHVNTMCDYSRNFVLGRPLLVIAVVRTWENVYLFAHGCCIFVWILRVLCAFRGIIVSTLSRLSSLSPLISVQPPHLISPLRS